jgi:hypothetical protein
VTYCDWREQKHIFDKIAGWWYPQVNLTDTGSEPQRVRAVDVTDAFFDTLGAKLMLGRGFQPAKIVREASASRSSGMSCGGTGTTPTRISSARRLRWTAEVIP